MKNKPTEIKHFGVLGMHWGHKKGVTSVTIGKNPNSFFGQLKVKKSKGKLEVNLSDAFGKRSYKDGRVKIDIGKKELKRILAVSGTIAVLNIAAKIALLSNS
jgi:hypothetical protein